MLYPNLFSPLQIGPVEVKNRLGFSPNCPVTRGDISGLFDEDSAYYYGERAKGGQGLVAIGETRVLRNTPFYPYMSSQLYDDQNIKPLGRVAREVHRYGARLIIQLYASCAGRGLEPQESSQSDDLEVELTVPGPSYLPGAQAVGATAPAGATLRQASVEDIAEIIEAYARAAERAAEAGLDGIEISAHSIYLPALFLRPRYNRRTDQYGGSMENRARFLIETLNAVRRRLGKGVVLGYKIQCAEFNAETTPGVAGPGDDMAEVVQYINRCTEVDYVHSVFGAPSLTLMDTAPPGWQMQGTARIKRVSHVPVFGVGGFTHPEDAEKAIASGYCDLVLLARQLFVDPEFANKAAEGRADDIRPCVHANYCRGRFYRGLRNECFQNPAQGREVFWGIGTLKQTTQPKAILVIGGGPAGLEVARIAAGRGHAVALYERRERVGGRLRLQARLPLQSEYGKAIAWYEYQLYRLRVPVHTSQEITPQNVNDVLAAEEPDVVVVATGSRPSRDSFNPHFSGPIPGAEQANVFSYEDMVDEKPAALSGKVLLLDETSTDVAPATALLLAQHAEQVRVITPWADVVLEPHALVNHDPWVKHLHRHPNIEIAPYTCITEIGEDHVTLARTTTGHTWREENVSAVVLATAPCPESTLYPLVKDRTPETHIIGDAVVPRQPRDAIFEGHRLGRKL